MDDSSSFVAVRHHLSRSIESRHSTSGTQGFGQNMDLDVSHSRQPLLTSQDVHYDEGELPEKKTKEKWACAEILCYLIALSANWLVDIVTGSATWIGRSLSCVCAQRSESDDRVAIDLTPLQEERLQRLKRRIEVSFDGTRADHQEALKALWHAAFPGRELHGLVSEQWKEMGWQGRDPSTDFRGGGFISLENLLFFAKTFPSFQRLLQKQEGNRATWEYPFAVAGVNITFMLIQILDLRSGICTNFVEKPRTLMGAIFLKMLAEDEWAFDLLYCITFVMMDAQWLAMHASYMEFNAVMKATRSQLERELNMDDVLRLEDMPSYSFLSQ
ncbi:uncharacterized protein LOC131076744 isoform X2 [Cryptomeria japonica]|uniref:uncharacterized protein LOC131076744 isoform X2 n=1 Tax=Cryptomeria japonica TaxID=3369 RepID=UPI0025AD42AF|nr:uncharacterized protein LOC131076744 isoform X2 [Cryptomeria japonica]